MKKFILISIILSSCASELSKKDMFVGQWQLVETTLGGANPTTIMEIKKDELFYTVDINSDKGNLFNEIKSHSNSEEERNMVNQMQKYQLSLDKRVLMNIIDPLNMIIYNEGNNTIQSPWGWFKKK